MFYIIVSMDWVSFFFFWSFKRLRSMIGSNRPLWNKYSVACEPPGTVILNVCSITLLPLPWKYMILSQRNMMES